MDGGDEDDLRAEEVIRMIRKILIGLAVLILGLVVVVAFQPADFRVTRSAEIDAPPAVVFGQVNDFHKWEAWSPWAKMDPAAKNTFAGPPAGEGASFSWAGNHEVGEGMMTITESRPPELVKLRLEFKKPFEGTSDTEFLFQPEGEGTRVTWTMSGTNNFLGKAIGLLMNCDKMIGPQFEQGLANMKQIAEAEARQPAAH